MKHWVEHHPDFWLPNWELVIGNLDACPDEAIFHMDNLGVAVHQVYLEEYKPILHLADHISKEYNDAPVTAQTMISFMSRSGNYGKHVDEVDVYILQALGLVDVSVWENENEYKYQLTPGHMIHIPKGLYHQITPLSPRVSISYGVEE